ncbi:hypothetical protein [Corynebacterium guaraldiae]|uniref:phage tail tube protein n=1 Tax=Corynebacterium guaraldiae TaxID=3051103 RepID=UPI001178C48F|nr:hypothetical protein [Corynebacterium guaraldiae]TRX43754.1 hypothetical protein FNY89_01225 [Corynebacterium guaraldiae]
MAFNDNAVFTASTGYVYVGPVGTAAPTPEQLADFDPDTFGAKSSKVTISGNPTGGTFTLTAGSSTTTPLKHDATAAAVQAALEKLSGIGSGGVAVSGSAKDGYTVSFIGENFGKDVKLTAAGESLTGGTSPAVKVATADGGTALGWEPIGHTGQDDLPEFGYDGGDTETKGSWQKKTLKEIVSEAPVDYVTVKALQFDEKTMELYYGKNASKTKGVFAIDDAGQSGVERAVMIVIVDGPFKIAFTAAKASVRRDESISLSTEDFSVLPLRATFVKHPGRHLFEWTAPAAA